MQEDRRQDEKKNFIEDRTNQASVGTIEINKFPAGNRTLRITI